MRRVNRIGKSLQAISTIETVATNATSSSIVRNVSRIRARNLCKARNTGGDSLQATAIKRVRTIKREVTKGPTPIGRSRYRFVNFYRDLSREGPKPISPPSETRDMSEARTKGWTLPTRVTARDRSACVGQLLDCSHPLRVRRHWLVEGASAETVLLALGTD